MNADKRPDRTDCLRPGDEDLSLYCQSVGNIASDEHQKKPTRRLDPAQRRARPKRARVMPPLRNRGRTAPQDLLQRRMRP